MLNVLGWQSMHVLTPERVVTATGVLKQSRTATQVIVLTQQPAVSRTNHRGVRAKPISVRSKSPHALYSHRLNATRMQQTTVPALWVVCTGGQTNSPKFVS